MKPIRPDNKRGTLVPYGDGWVTAPDGYPPKAIRVNLALLDKLDELEAEQEVDANRAAREARF